MMMWLDALEGGIYLKLHHTGKIGEEDEGIFNGVIQDYSFVGDTNNCHEVGFPHLSDQSDTNVNVASLLLQLHQQPLQLNG